VYGSIPWHPPQDHLNLGRKQLNVYFGRIFIRAPRLELEELNHLRHKATEIAPQILWSIVKVIRCEETCFELGLANSCLLELAKSRITVLHPITRSPIEKYAWLRVEMPSKHARKVFSDFISFDRMSGSRSVNTRLTFHSFGIGILAISRFRAAIV
jgi:hypothetical protein